jgi:hypothetical protein
MNREANGKAHFGASDASNEPAAGPTTRLPPFSPMQPASFFGFIFNSLLTLTLDGHRHTHSAADAKRCQTFFRIAPCHFVEQGDENPAS